MKKKIMLSILVLVSALVISISFVSGMDNIGNVAKETTEGIKNTAENFASGIGNTASDMSKGAKNVTSDMERGMQDMTSGVGSAMHNTTNSVVGMTTNHNSSYSAERTSSMGDTPIVFGMNASTLTWLILGLIAIAIISLIWTYVKERNEASQHIEH